MKLKKIYISIFFIITVFITSLHARKAGDVQLSFNTAAGLTNAGGTLPHKYDMGGMLESTLSSGVTRYNAFEDGYSETGLSLSLGLGANFFINPATLINFSVMGQVKSGKLIYPKNQASDQLTLDFPATFITLSLSLRNYVSDFFFFGLGLFYAIQVGDWKAQMKFANLDNEVSASQEDGNEFGFLFEIGYHIPLSENFSLDIIARLEWGLEDYLSQNRDDGTDFGMQSRTFMFLFATNYHL